MIAVVVIFAICWLPQHTYFVVQNLQQNIICYRHIHHVYLVIYWFAMSNSMYNPIMYCWMNARYGIRSCLLFFLFLLIILGGPLKVSHYVTSSYSILTNSK